MAQRQARYPEVMEGSMRWSDGRRIFLGPTDEGGLAFRIEIDTDAVTPATLDALRSLERACIDSLRLSDGRGELTLVRGA